MRIANVPEARPSVPQVVVPLRNLDRSALAALAYARSISQDVTALWITDDPAEAERIREDWPARKTDLPLVVIDSPRRQVVMSLLAYLTERERQDPLRPVAVVLADVVPRRHWRYLLHDKLPLLLKLRLYFRPNTVVVDVPYHL